MKRTTLFAEEEILERYQRMAQNEGISTAELIRKALHDYLSNRSRKSVLPSFVGIGRSGHRDTSERIDELLWKDSRLGKHLKKRK